MGFCIQLSSEKCIGVGDEFHQQLDSVRLLTDWSEYKASVLMPGNTYDDASLSSQGRRFCHVRGVAILIGSTVLMSRVPKRSGSVARYPVLESVLCHQELKDEWDEYFIGSGFGLLDNDGARDPSNWGIFWNDVDRFFSIQGYQISPLIESSLPHDTVMSLLKGNLKLSDLNLSDEQLDVVSLAANGIISNESALNRLKKLSS